MVDTNETAPHRPRACSQNSHRGRPLSMAVFGKASPFRLHAIQASSDISAERLSVAVPRVPLPMPLRSATGQCSFGTKKEYQHCRAGSLHASLLAVGSKLGKLRIHSTGLTRVGQGGRDPAAYCG